MEHLGGGVLQGKAGHLDGRALLFLGRKGHCGHFFLNVLLPLVLVHFSAVLQLNGRAGSGALQKAVCQLIGEFHAFQNVAPGIHLNFNALSLQGDGCAVQKAVDGHALFFQLVQYLAQGRLGELLVAKIVFGFDLVALKLGRQAHAQPRTQSRVQRGGAAQAQDHPAALAALFHFFQQNAAEGGSKLRVGPKFGPDLRYQQIQCGVLSFTIRNIFVNISNCISYFRFWGRFFALVA